MGRWEVGCRLGAADEECIFYCLKVPGVPCSAMTTGYVGYPRHEGTRAANELLRRVMACRGFVDL